MCRNLDALSHFFYQPKPVAKEATIKSLGTTPLPSIMLEDIMPVTESIAVAQAPEEVPIIAI